MRHISIFILGLTTTCFAGIVAAQDTISAPVETLRQNQPVQIQIPTIEADNTISIDNIQTFGRERTLGTFIGTSDDGVISLSLVSNDHILQTRIAEATKKLQSDDTKEQTQATTELQAAVTELFELRAKERLKQIEGLEQRIGKLKNQMKLREAKKSEIIQLQVQTYINQANGLGF